MTAAPPSLEGADHVTVALASPAVADAPVGASGIVIGVTALDGADAGPVPAALVAVTVTVSVVPLGRAEIGAVVTVPAGVATGPAGVAVTGCPGMARHPAWGGGVACDGPFAVNGQPGLRRLAD